MSNKTKAGEGWRRDVTFEAEHPSYGMLMFSRVQGGNPRLFGSALNGHQSFIRLTLLPGMMEHNLNHDRYTSTSITPLVEVDLSAAQFAELLTTMSTSPGVPCTIRHINGKTVEDPPEIETETERIRSSFSSDLTRFVNRMQELRAEGEKLTEKLPEKSKKALKHVFDGMIMQLESNLPFIADQFDKATDKMVSSAKAEIEAFMSHQIHAAGLAAIASGAAAALQSPTAVQLSAAPAAQPGTGSLAIREQHACEICAAIPDSDGCIAHGRGCYAVSADGGGESWVELAPDTTLEEDIAKRDKSKHESGR